ncbi:DNA polymerase IV [Paenibacillus radicis (ex Xue et al. 2023)]|uniref:DNA polymerase IV n=1 Tax=Paenibacillus radicis (ex Xue et al. 2023) TaxID=2972489 RepID=A0ABT1YD50_9BACL|nr:DNA polymerase IV [Paenibacillus radicis (ex Xue et al. 2023)]MCR8631118.1 DNA polymerase IV [Paenibacillus radicis (ex Xue et al. 2023)]
MNIENKQAYPVNGRVILHIDMNAFYCSVHEAVEPELYKGKPTAVAGSVELRKGIIVTCSYAARAKGIKTGMLVGQAVKKCPELILIRPNFDLYRQYSRAFMNIVYNYSPMVEAMSIDECYVDITGSKQFGTPLEIAELIQNRIRKELLLPCSVGVAPNKLLAKMASDMKKPNGLTVLRKRDVPRVLWDLPCANLYGIGGKTAEKLKRLNIHTLGQLAKAEEKLLREHFGVMGVVLRHSANGEDDSPVHPEREQSKSIGHTTTLPINFTDLADIRRVFLNLSDQVGRRLRKQMLLAQTIQITIRDPDMRTITRAAKLQTPTENREDIYSMACKLFEEHWSKGKPVRLLGITLQNLLDKAEAAVQLDLFDYEKQPVREKLNKTLDALRDKFGESAILTAGMLGDDPSSLIRDHKARGTSLQMDHLKLNRLEDEK